MPVVWSSPTSSAPAPHIAVILHAHYPEVAPNLLDAVNAMGVEFDLFVTTSRADVAEAIERNVPSNARLITVFGV